MEFYNKLDLASNRFTKAEKKIADYISIYPEQVLYMSITDLSTKIGVSETSIFRFCKTLGYEGYQAFKVSLAKTLSISNNVNVAEVQQKITKEDSVDTLIGKLHSSSTMSLNQTNEILDRKQVEKAVSMIKTAQTIGFFGIGSSNLSAAEAKRAFSRIRRNVTHTWDLHDQIILASSMEKNDLAVIFSYSGATRDIIELMASLKGHQVPIILITRYHESSATKYADVTLLCGTNSLFTGDTVSNKISQLFIIDILYTYFYMQNYEISKANKTNSLAAISPRIY